MRSLVAEDDYVQRRLLARHVRPFGVVDAVENGELALEACRSALAAGKPYELVLLDICMPGLDGVAALGHWREEEAEAGLSPGQGSTIIMTTSVDVSETIIASFRRQCDAYLVKPVLRFDLIRQLRELGLVE